MVEIKNLSKTLESLPSELQRQILDYIEFVVKKYQNAPDLPDDEKKAIDQRIKYMEEHPEENLEWSEARKEIFRQMDWK